MHDNEGELGDLELNERNTEETLEVRQKPHRSRLPLLIFLLLLFAASATAVYFFVFAEQPTPPTAIVVAPTTEPTPAPIPTLAPTPDPLAQSAAPTPTPTPTPIPLPLLNKSDDEIRQQIDNLQLSTIAELLTPEEIVRKFVRAVYNLGQGKIVPQYRPLNGPNSTFKAQAIGRMAKVAASNPEDGVIQTAVFKNPGTNQQRYATYISVAENMNISTVVKAYETYYPILQQAYSELGEGPEQFHSAVLGALDSFLATPKLEGEPELILTSVQYQFLDPKLEALPTTQKLMLRIGEENRQRLLPKLEELKQALLLVSP
ncbi:DUF3014 domain-containing protein [Teredinibacter franksiae]|uniref:DUF3014 domain-containing protein n=1 Tax=Teredinibacter franksiae TaxID=2761453 RepID=UPI001628F740|nr:DUF3014 domain-containing protein [Teredinibacter franksiae]